MHSSTVGGVRHRVAIIAIAVVAVASGCGGENADKASERHSSSSSPRWLTADRDREIPDPPVIARTDEQEIQEIVDDIQDALLMLQGSGICKELSSKAELAAASGGGNCAAAYDRLLRTPAMERRRRARSRVESVDVLAGRAVARLLTPGLPPVRLVLVREPDGWKLPRVNLTTPTGFDTN